MAALTPFIIPIFTPHLGCPHRCVFCDQHAITGTRLDVHQIPRIIETALSSPRRKSRPVEIAFYGGNFASLPEKTQNDLLEPCGKYLDFGFVESIRISSRPDALDQDNVQRLKSLGVGTIEIGAQSLDDRVLMLAERGHTSRRTEEAARVVRSAGIRMGIQLMLGLPGDTREKALETARKVVALAPEIARIYPTLVLRGSELARRYLAGQYRPLLLNQALQLCSEVVTVLELGNVRVIRIGLQDNESLTRDGGFLAGPHHPAFGQMVRSLSWLSRAQAALERCPDLGDSGDFRVHPSQVGNLRGQKNGNLHELRKRWGLREIDVVGDPSLNRTECRFEPN